LPKDECARALIRQEDVLDEEHESLKNGANVTYETVQGTEGVEARNVRCV
jgi:cold shock CspA family protein